MFQWLYTCFQRDDMKFEVERGHFFLMNPFGNPFGELEFNAQHGSYVVLEEFEEGKCGDGLEKTLTMQFELTEGCKESEKNSLIW
jgi:hypothetical protein